MIINRMAGGGVGGSDFFSNVYSASSLPGSGTDDDVCVISSTQIGVIQAARVSPATRADGTDLVSGDLWIAQGLTADKAISPVTSETGLIVVYPLFFSLWNGSAWVSVDAYKRVSGSWVVFRKYLYGHGLVNTPLIGSFKKVNEGDMDIYENTESLKSYWNGGVNIAAWKYGATQIDLTPYSSLKGIAWTHKQYNSGFWLAIGYLNRAPTTSDPRTAMTGYSAVSTLRTTTTLSLDISAVNATRYVMACFNGCDGDIFQIWLE